MIKWIRRHILRQKQLTMRELVQNPETQAWLLESVLKKNKPLDLPNSGMSGMELLHRYQVNRDILSQEATISKTETTTKD
jgi:hypothetical protein